MIFLESGLYRRIYFCLFCTLMCTVVWNIMLECSGQCLSCGWYSVDGGSTSKSRKTGKFPKTGDVKFHVIQAHHDLYWEL